MCFAAAGNAASNKEVSVDVGGVDLRMQNQGSNNANLGFLDVDERLKEGLLDLGQTATKQKDNWARRKFDLWRKVSGVECDIPLEKLDLRELNVMLSKFFLVVCKQGGGLFPSDTLMGMFRCFGRMIKKEQDLRVAATGVCEVPFDIVRNPIFKSAQNSVLAAMRRSVAAGACKDRKKASVIGVSLEEEILRDVDFSIQHNRGCQMRFAFFCMLHFSIRGGLELHKLQRTMFSHGSDELGQYVRFSERLSKNCKVDLMHYQPEHFRPPVTVRDGDVVGTFNQLMRHMPPILEGDKNLFFVFLQPISSPCTQVWYNRNRVSVKALSNLVKSIGDRSGLGGNFSNKSLRNTCVTRMSLGQVPRDVGMLVTGHKRVTSYDKYDLSSEVRMAAAQDILSEPFDESGKLKTYPSVLEEKFSNFSKNIEGTASENVVSDNCKMKNDVPTNGSGGDSGLSSNATDSGLNSGGQNCGGSAQVKSSTGMCFAPYKFGDDLPFDENLLNELPAESVRALGLDGRHLPRLATSVFLVCSMTNCVVNVYVGKENLPFNSGN